ncbi:dna polymerase iv [Fusarium langsethiae]|uniref:DNA polymerase n=1 Tax=Fusarium langsethiae TaxID=179993 RepID=A0A0M9F0Y6_FUSLA|nr:dna polymerase iv [Fusarium langsethiae]GKU02034.1 unnamed protein product [Fusarium langsethiae]GKU15107.1 unnamed protein product [Fusarium langsethiae]
MAVTKGPDDDPDPKRRRVTGNAVGGHDTVKIVKLAWFLDSLERKKLLPIDQYLVCQVSRVSAREGTPVSVPVCGSESEIMLSIGSTSPANGILERALAEQKDKETSTSPQTRNKRRHNASTTLPQNAPSLLHQTTSEHDIALPMMPEFLRTIYSCERPTYENPPNEAFVKLLTEIKTIRQLRGDDVGVRAYSTSIASVAAYPYPLKNPQGWRDLDDLVEYGWNTLSRSQQIGVKYYNEFLLSIPQEEVSFIGATILKHARRIDPGFEMVIVGGHRRGKQNSGDVDVVLSHRDESKTLHVISKIVVILEQAHLVTHTLVLSTHNSERGQRPVSWKGQTSSSSGFDSLDKALVVWKDRSRENAPHRRVDIIISPWKTVGCAVLGWSGGTTFQRDLRQYCKYVKGYKFDSSGIRHRADGRWVDLEGTSADNAAPDMETAERRVFGGLGLPWRPPEARCTG